MSPPPRLCLPLSALDPNHILRAHIILGFTRDGMHLLSYSHVIPFGYTLFIWRFGRPPTLLLTVPLFRNELYSSLTQHLQQSVFVPTESEWFSNSINYHPQMLIRIVHSPELPVNLNNTLPYKVTISLLIAHAQPLGEPLSRDDSSTNVCHYVTVIPWILEEKVQTLRTPTQCIHMTYEASCDEHWEPEIMFQYPILLLSTGSALFVLSLQVELCVDQCIRDSDVDAERAIWYSQLQSSSLCEYWTLPTSYELSLVTASLSEHKDAFSPFLLSVIYQRKLNVELCMNYFLRHYDHLRNADVQDYDFSVIQILLDKFTVLCAVTLRYRTCSPHLVNNQYSAFLFSVHLFTGRIEVLKAYQQLSSPPPSVTLKEFVREILILPLRNRDLLLRYVAQLQHLQQRSSPHYLQPMDITRRSAHVSALVSIPFIPPRGLYAILPLGEFFILHSPYNCPF
jgi:hypothetical protein